MSKPKELKAGRYDTLIIFLCIIAQDLEKQWSEAVKFGEKANIFSTMTAYFRHKNSCPACAQEIRR